MKLGIGLFLVSLLISLVLLNPSIKKETIKLFLGDEKEILSQMGMTFNDTLYRVVKVKNSKGLAIEVYKKTDEGDLLVDSHPLSDKKDAHYKFDNEKYNLFLKDVNDDTIPDIIVPSLDKNMRARLNVFSFDPENERLQKMTQH